MKHTKQRHARFFAWSTALLFAVLGCGGGDSFELAPVSGKITLDGKPVAEATIAFQPVTEGRTVNPGPGSVSTTDANGSYRLLTVQGDTGAVIGKHRVRITTRQANPGQNEDEAQPADLVRETIPTRYNSDTMLSLEVPAGGTDSADFALTSGK